MLTVRLHYLTCIYIYCLNTVYGIYTQGAARQNKMLESSESNPKHPEVENRILAVHVAGQQA